MLTLELENWMRYHNVFIMNSGIYISMGGAIGLEQNQPIQVLNKLRFSYPSKYLW